VKKLVTVNDIKNYAGSGQKTIYLEPGTIVTPAAKDAAGEFGVSLQFGSVPVPAKVSCCGPVENVSEDGVEPRAVNFQGIDPGLISKIVQQVIASLPQLQGPKQIVKEADPSGIRLVRGETVECEAFDTGNPKDKVGIREILSGKESPNLATGFMTMEKSSFEWTLGYEEIDYIIEGTLEITVDGRTYRGRAGDVFYIPKDTHITFSTPDKVKFFFVTYPANWAELSNKQ
jgi:ethanolamine utilization protein EutQ